MSKTKPKKIVKADKRPEQAKDKNHGEEKGAKRDAGEVKPPPASSQWTEWIWDEGLKLFYRARPEKGDWAYEYAYPAVHPATKKEISGFIAEKFEFPKVEEKVIFAEPEYRFEVPNTKGSGYLVSVCEVMRVGMVGGGAGKPSGGENGKPGGQAAAGKIEAGGNNAAKIEGAGKAGDVKDGKKSGPKLKSVDGEASRGAVKKQPEKEGKKKDREKHHERRGREKERRK